MSFNEAMQRFRDYFRDDLLGFMHTDRRQGKRLASYRAVVVGGYGLRTLLETKLGKLGVHDRVRTYDCDITITSFRSKKDLYDTYKAFVQKITQFVHEQEHPEHFQVVLVDQANQYIQALDYHRFAVVMIKYKGFDFVDIAFTDMKLTMDAIDKGSSSKAGLPLKTLDAYLHDLLSLVYLENVSNIYPYLYWKRNPIDGQEPSKGKKDIQRAKLACELTKSKKYIEYCGLINRITINEMAEMTRAQRNEYFKALSTLIAFRKQKIKDLTVDSTQQDIII